LNDNQFEQERESERDELLNYSIAARVKVLTC